MLKLRWWLLGAAGLVPIAVVFVVLATTSGGSSATYGRGQVTAVVMTSTPVTLATDEPAGTPQTVPTDAPVMARTETPVPPANNQPHDTRPASTPEQAVPVDPPTIAPSPTGVAPTPTPTMAVRPSPSPAAPGASYGGY